MEELDKAIIRKLQEDLPLVKEPYKQIAKELDITEDELLKKINLLKQKKMLRRIGGILHHRTAGFNANAMVVWEVPKERIRAVAEVMIGYQEVSHCYERETLPHWPYNIYTMIHADQYESCEALINHIAKETNLDKYQVLYSTQELKKSSMKYFE